MVEQNSHIGTRTCIYTHARAQTGAHVTPRHEHYTTNTTRRTLHDEHYTTHHTLHHAIPHTHTSRTPHKHTTHHTHTFFLLTGLTVNNSRQLQSFFLVICFRFLVLILFCFVLFCFVLFCFVLFLVLSLDRELLGLHIFFVFLGYLLAKNLHMITNLHTKTTNYLVIVVRKSAGST